MSNAQIRSIEITRSSSDSDLSTVTVYTADGSGSYHSRIGDISGEEMNRIQEQVSNALDGIDAAHQQEVDDILSRSSQTFDGNTDISTLISGVSIANAKTAAAVMGTPLYEHLRNLAGTHNEHKAPRLFIDLICGGKENDSPLSFSAFRIIPETDTVNRAHKVARDIKTALGTVLRTQTVERDLPAGHDGAYCPRSLEFNQTALEMLLEGVAEAFPEVKVKLAVDADASQFIRGDIYRLDQQDLTVEQLHDYYDYLIDRFKISFIEDPFDVSNGDQIRALQERHPDLTIVHKIQTRTRNDVERYGISAVTIDPSALQTLTAALTAIRSSEEMLMRCIIDQDNAGPGEHFLADLAVGCGCYGLKIGAPGTPTSDSLYERLAEIV